MYTCGHFLLVSLHLSLSTHILQKIHKDNSSKNTTIITHFRRQPFHYVTLSHSSYYLNWFSLSFLCAIGYPPHAYIKIQLNISLKKHHWALLYNSLRKLKTSQEQHLGPKIPATNSVNLVIPGIHFAWISYDYTPVICSTGSYPE